MTSSAIDTIAKSFSGGQLLLAGTEECKKLNKSYLSCLESDLTPAAIFLPKNVDDVAKFVEVIGPLAVDGTMPFASKYLPSYHAKQRTLRPCHFAVLTFSAGWWPRSTSISARRLGSLS